MTTHSDLSLFLHNGKTSLALKAGQPNTFKAKAGEIAKGFGFTGYTLREVSVNASDTGNPPRPRMMAMEAKAASSDMAVPVEAGKSTVQVTVSGAVQLK